jgi:hypothetical protein
MSQSTRQVNNSPRTQQQDLERRQQHLPPCLYDASSTAQIESQQCASKWGITRSHSMLTINSNLVPPATTSKQRRRRIDLIQLTATDPRA